MASPRGASIGRPFEPWTTLADETLDAPVRPLVHALNATGWVWTVFSCGGHPEEPVSVQEGRRQAHVDVVTLDPRRWRAFARRCQDALRTAPRSDRSGGVRVKVVEGPLGALPEWLQPALRSLPYGGDARAKALHWEYRRLVFEPRPYDAPPEACRGALDAALAVALGALQSTS